SPGNCRNLKFTSFPKPGYRLENRSVRTIEVFDEDLCKLQCYLEPNCVSFNFHKLRQASGTHKCDLNNATIEHDGKLVENESYIYRGAENACASNPCRNNATCQAGFTHRDYQCLCAFGSGFEGHDWDKDIDECSGETNGCDENAECNNTLGSYKCICKDGFQGNETNCKDLDECADGTHNCDVNAECNNTLASYNCTCKDGFRGNGTSCKDLDECADGTHNCDVNAECNNTLGSYNCMCKDGFSGNGTKCTGNCLQHIILSYLSIFFCFLLKDVNEFAFCGVESYAACFRGVTSKSDSMSESESRFYDHYQSQCEDTVMKITISAEFTGILFWFTAVFTTLGKGGTKGPVQIGSHYAGQDHDGQVTLSSGIQQWTVPHTGEYRIEAIGASGGYGEDSIIKNGGRGARMIGNFILTKYEIIHILVGQEGKKGRTNSKTAGGGGGTFVVRRNNTPLIIAGGGGGIKNMSEQHPGCDASINTTGNAGNNSPLGSGGIEGQGGLTNGVNSGGGGGGFHNNGHNATNSSGGGGKGGSGYLQGGEGGKVLSGFGGGGGLHTVNKGPGGGGGYTGGSGGANDDIACGGGGGSFNNGTNQQNEYCNNSAGHGWVNITFLR
ncbi:unnamed protein product, partial [Pocillopora meandrina]